MKTNYQNRVFGLDIVRATAIILVLISHCVLLIMPENVGVIATAFRLGGALGVDIFFVLSGFLIGGILIRSIDENKITFKDFGYFWVRRWFRTLPNYYLILIVNIILGYFVFKNLPNTIFDYFFFFQNFYAPQPNFFTESWTLTIEEFSYIIGPLLLFLLLFLKIKKNTVFLVSTLVLIFIGISAKLYFYLNIESSDYHFWTTNLRKVVLYRIDSIYYGFLSIYIFKRFLKERKKLIKFFFYIGIIILILMHILIFTSKATVVNSPLFFTVFYLPMVSSCFGLMLWKMANLKTGWHYLLKPITFISVLSYSIYLINYSIIVLLIERYIPIPESIIDKIGLVIFFLGLTMLFSYLLHRFYEIPTTKLRNHPFILRFLNQTK